MHMPLLSYPEIALASLQKNTNETNIKRGQKNTKQAYTLETVVMYTKESLDELFALIAARVWERQPLHPLRCARKMLKKLIENDTPVRTTRHVACVLRARV